MYARQIGTGNNYLYPVEQFSHNDMDEYVQKQYINMNLQEVLPQSFSASNFQQGVLDFIISTSNNFGIIWNRSFFRIDLELNVPNIAADLVVPENVNQNRGNIPKMKDVIAFSRYFGGNLWQSTSFSISNQTIEETTQNTPQLNVVNNRLGYSGSFLYNNKDLLYSEPDLQKRIQDVSADALDVYDRFTPIPLAMRPYFYNKTNSGDASISVTYTEPGLAKILTINSANEGGDAQTPSFPQLGLGIGSVLTRCSEGSTFTIVSFVDKRNISANVTVTGAAIGNPFGPVVFFSEIQNTGFIVTRPYDNGLALTNQCQKSILFQPPLGIFQIEEPLAGEFKVSLNPSSDAFINAVQSVSNNLVYGTDYTLAVKNVRLYCCVVRHTFSPERSLKLKLMSMKIYAKQITSSSPTFEFTVPPSTRAFSIFLQDSSVGKAGSLNLSPAEFRSKDRKAFQIKSLQTTYGSISIPATNYTTDDDQNVLIDNTKIISYVAGPVPVYLPTKNNEQMRYWDFLMTTGKLFSEGGAESFKDWSNSPIYVYDYSNSENTRATNLTLALNLAGGFTSTDNVSIYVIAHYSKVVSGTYKSNILADIAVGDI